MLKHVTFDLQAFIRGFELQLKRLDVANETLRRLFSRTRLRLARLGGFLGSHRGVPRRLNGVMGILSITHRFSRVFELSLEDFHHLSRLGESIELISLTLHDSSQLFVQRLGFFALLLHRFYALDEIDHLFLAILQIFFPLHRNLRVRAQFLLHRRHALEQTRLFRSRLDVRRRFLPSLIDAFVQHHVLFVDVHGL